ncbi:MAG: RNA polymerase sigma factor RpoD/SigA [Armatimonadota bacterium]
MTTPAGRPHRPHERDEIPSFLERLTREPLLTADEEKELAFRAQQGDEEARKRLVEANMRLVINVARNYRSPAFSLEDLVQEGAIGLLKAITKFDPSRGYRFSTYAMFWIRQAIGRSIENKSRAIRLPAHIREAIRRIDRRAAELALALGREPTISEVAHAVGISERRILRLLQCVQDTVSLDGMTGEDQSDYTQLLPDPNCEDPEHHTIQSESRRLLDRALQDLPLRERRAVRRRLGLDTEDGDEEASRESRRLMGVRAIQRLRAIAERHRLREYFES